jgi:hypothetical protein
LTFAFFDRVIALLRPGVVFLQFLQLPDWHDRRHWPAGTLNNVLCVLVEHLLKERSNEAIAAGTEDKSF